MGLSSTPAYRRLPYFLLALAVVLVWGRAISFEFVFWDDGELIYANPYVMAPRVGTLARAWQGPHAAMFIPVVYNIWWGIAQVGKALGGAFIKEGVPPWPFHLANLVVHYGCCCLVYGILQRIGLRRWPSLLGTLVFAIHPLQAEAVCWATGMKDLLSSFLALVSIHTYLNASAAWETRRVAGHALYSVSLLAAVLGSLAKPGIVGAPIIAACLDMTFISGLSWRSTLRAVGLVSVIIPSILWTRIAQSVVYDSGISVSLRPSVALHALGFYFQKLLIPSRLCIDYGLRPVIVVTQWKHLALGFVAPTLLLLVVATRIHRKHLIVSGIVFVAGVLPVLGLMPFVFQNWSTVADRYVYLAMLGPSIGVAYLFAMIRPRMSILVGALLAIGLGFLASRQAMVWHDTITLMDHTIRINGESAAAYNNFAAAFCPPVRSERGALGQPTAMLSSSNGLSPEVNAEMRELAQRYFERAFALRPEYPDPMKNMLRNLAGGGRYREAISLFEIAVKLFPDRVFPLYVDPCDVAWLYTQVGQYDKAMQVLGMAHVMNPSDDRVRIGTLEVLQKRHAATTQSIREPVRPAQQRSR